MNELWPTLEEYKAYEDAVISSIGLHGGSFLPANAAAARHAAYRRRYTDAGSGAGLPFASEKAREALMQLLSEQHDVFVKYYTCMKAKTPLVPASAVAETSLNTVLRDMKLLSVLSVGETSKLQETCVKHLQDVCGARPAQRPNALPDATPLTCYDYYFSKELESDVREAVTVYCYTILVQRKATEPVSRVSVRANKQTEGASADTATTTMDNNTTDRIRIGDVIQDVAENYPDIDWYDRETEGEIKMKVGMMMASDERRKRKKRKRDELGARIYSNEDRDDIVKYISKAVKFCQHNKDKK